MTNITQSMSETSTTNSAGAHRMSAATGSLRQRLQDAVCSAESYGEFLELAFTAVELDCNVIASSCHEFPAKALEPGRQQDALEPPSVLLEHARADLVHRDEVSKWLRQCRLKITGVLDTKVFQCNAVRNLSAVCSAVSSSGSTRCVVTLVTANDVDKEAAVVAVDLLATFSSVWFLRDQAKTSQIELTNTAAILELVGRAESSETQAEACMTIANELRDHLSCKFVAIGLRSDDGNGKLECVSGLAHFDNASSLARKLESAHDETFLRRTQTSWPPVDSQHSHQSLAHRQLIENSGVEGAISIPLTNENGSTIGCLTVAGPLRLIVDSRTRHLVTALNEPIGNVLHVARRAQGSRLQRGLKRITSNQWATRRRILLIGLLLATIAMLIPVPLKIRCNCQLEPKERRFSVAPYDGLLEQTLVEPGDVVEQGELLAKMDGREIQWELAGVTAERHRAITELDTHVARHNTSESMMAEAEVERLGTRADLLRYRQDNMEVRSPVKGLVLSGSIDRRENYPVNVGQILYEVAPLDVLRVEVSIPAEEVGQIEAGMDVEIRFDGRLLDPRKGKIARVRPRSSVRENENVFVAYVEIENGDGRLRPGMMGTARVTGNRHMLGWNLFHTPWEHFAAFCEGLL